MSAERPPSGRPNVEVHVHCDKAGDRQEEWRKRTEAALTECLSLPPRSPKRRTSLLATLPMIEISLVSDATIAAIHGEFMDDPSPTDVITFEHGEILVSAETAERQAAQHGHSAGREAWLYLIHGLLHLCGYDDREEAEREEMESVQNRILESLSPFPTRLNHG